MKKDEVLEKSVCEHQWSYVGPVQVNKQWVYAFVCVSCAGARHVVPEVVWER